MMRLAILLLTLLGLVFPGANPTPAAADTRVALVIGNSSYHHLDVPRTASDDARAIAAALARAGFAVELELDLERPEMQRALRELGDAAGSADLALAFYAGHAIRIAGRNYLLPVDAAKDERNLLFDAVPLDLLVAEVAKARRLGMAIVDASQAGDLTERLRRTLGPSRAQLIGDGLANVTDLPAGTVVAFAAQPGQLAADIEGEHSAYTAALLQQVAEPGLTIDQLLRKVRETVLLTTANRQEPIYHTTLSVELSSYLLAPQAGVSANELVPPEGGWPVPGSYETVRGANIRHGPDRTSERVTAVAAGTPLRVLGRVEGGGWYQVETVQGQTGFISGALIRPGQVVALAGRPADLTKPPPDETLVRVFYGTDRVNVATAAAPRFSGARARRLSLGTVVVRIPRHHQIGRIERPWSLGLLGLTLIERAEDPERHFTILKIEGSDEAAFVEALSRTVSAARAYRKQALVFVHGFNVSFDAAAFRTAQIAYDLQFDGAPILYSWPSRGDLSDYEYDQNSASQARPHIEEFLELVRRRSGAEVIHLIAHSMGTNPLMEVLAELNERESAAGRPLFNEVVLAAPDIDVDVFHYLAKEIRGVARGITLYASSADRAMQISRKYARGVARAGDVPPSGPVVQPGIDTIDASAIGTDFFSLNHSGYAENRILLNDLGLLLRAGLRPPNERNLTLVRVSVSDGYYWKHPD